jgi:hypothetical protein
MTEKRDETLLPAVEIKLRLSVDVTASQPEENIQP